MLDVHFHINGGIKTYKDDDVDLPGRLLAFHDLSGFLVEGKTACVLGLKGRDIPARGNALGTWCKDSRAL